MFRQKKKKKVRETVPGDFAVPPGLHSPVSLHCCVLLQPCLGCPLYSLIITINVVVFLKKNTSPQHTLIRTTSVLKLNMFHCCQKFHKDKLPFRLRACCLHGRYLPKFPPSSCYFTVPVPFRLFQQRVRGFTATRH